MPLTNPYIAGPLYLFHRDFHDIPQLLHNSHHLFDYDYVKHLTRSNPHRNSKLDTTANRHGGGLQPQYENVAVGARHQIDRHDCDGETDRGGDEYHPSDRNKNKDYQHNYQLDAY